MADVPLKCRCGKFQGRLKDVSPSSTNRLTCYCVDCQSFARHLGGDDVMDEWGGTDVCQVSPTSLEITEGREHLAALRLSPKGLVRWYASCCKTPLANTMQKPRVPFIGVQRVMVDLDDAGLEQHFGAHGKTVNTHQSTGNQEALAKGQSTWTMVRAGAIMAKWKLSGHASRDPLFNGTEPIVKPTVISKEERAGLLAQCGPTAS